MDREHLESAEETTQEVELAQPVETTAATETTESAPAAETTEATTTTTQETTATTTAEPVKNSTFFDKFGENGEKKESAATTTTEETIPKSELEKLKAKYEAEIESYKNSAAGLFKGDKDIREVNLTELLKEAVGEDYNKMSPEQLMMRKIQSEYPSLSPVQHEELLKEEMATLDTFSDVKKQAELSKIADTLTKSKPENNILKKLSDIQADQKLGNPEEFFKQKYDEVTKNAYTELNAFLTESLPTLIGQQYMGYTFTKEDSEKTHKMIAGMIENFDQERMVYLYSKAATYENAVKTAEERGYQKGLNEKANPNRNETGAPVIVANTQKQGLATASKDQMAEAQ